MDIRNWPIEKIMQLPNEAFGTREVLQLAVDLTSADPVYVISPAGLPDKMVIWEINVAARAAVIVTIHAGLAFGEQLPASDVEFDNLETVFPNVISSDGDRGEFEVSSSAGFDVTQGRFPVVVSGRRLIGKLTRHQGNATEGVIVVVYSSIPTEIPDFYAGSPMDKWDELIRLLRIGVKFPG